MLTHWSYIFLALTRLYMVWIRFPSIWVGHFRKLYQNSCVFKSPMNGQSTATSVGHQLILIWLLWFEVGNSDELPHLFVICAEVFLASSTLSDWSTGDCQHLCSYHSIGLLSWEWFEFKSDINYDELLTHWGQLTHICMDQRGHHWVRYCLVAC